MIAIDRRFGARGHASLSSVGPPESEAPTPRTILATVVLVAALSGSGAGATVGRAGAFGGAGTIVPPSAPDGLPPNVLAEIARRSAVAPKPSTGDQQAQFTEYRWPLERLLKDGLTLVNYTDLDPTAGRLDYEGGTHNYDGHTGIDYLLDSFRLMDRGCRITAAAPGTVVYLDNSSPYDRHCDSSDWPDAGNWVWIRFADGSYHEYLHMRSNSMVVQLGEAVLPGQLLGLVGSSGYSTGPHLHFETGDDTGPGGTYKFREPYHGTANLLPSLWVDQGDYVGDDPLRFIDLGVFSESQVGGSIFNINYCDVIGSVQQPRVFGLHERILPMWFAFQSRCCDVATITVRKPDGSVFGSFDYTVPEKIQWGWIWAYFYWDGGVDPPDFGTWRVQVEVSGQLQKERTFAVGAATAWSPRFWPRAGRSFRINGTVQRDTLRCTPLASGPITYALVSPPAGVSLVQDSILVIPSLSSQTTRSRFFIATMTDASARRDTAWFHLVDFSKSADLPLDAPMAETPGTLGLGRPTPNPSRASTTFAFTLPRDGTVRLEILDVGGRRVRSLLRGPQASGAGSARWDGRDEAGRPSPPGVYLVRLEACGTVARQKIVKVE